MLQLRSMRETKGYCLSALALLAGISVLSPTQLFGGDSDQADFFRVQRMDFEMRRGMRPLAYQGDPGQMRSPFFGLRPDGSRPMVPPTVERPAPPAARSAPPPVKAAQSQPRKRFVCARLCDGNQLALGFGGQGVSTEDFASMCEAAGAGAETVLITSESDGSAAKVVSSRGKKAAEAVSVETLVTDLRGKNAAQCPATIAQAQLSVPIDADPTLQAGDIVATSDGFKVFVGSARGLPHPDRAFASIDARRVSASTRKLVNKLQIAETD